MQENIDEIIKEMRQIRPDCDDCISNHVCGYLSRFADRLDAAYKREVKSMCESWYRDQLIQAGMMESNKKSKKKYEYIVKYIDNSTGRCTWEDRVRHYESIKRCMEDHHFPLYGESMRFFRREVGEWKEVK